MSNIRDFIEAVGLTDKGVYDEHSGQYTLPLMNSDDFAHVYSVLDTFEGLDFVPDLSMSTEELTQVTFENDEYRVSLNANMAEDIYTCIFKPLKGIEEETHE